MSTSSRQLQAAPKLTSRNIEENKHEKIAHQLPEPPVVAQSGIYDIGSRGERSEPPRREQLEDGAEELGRQACEEVGAHASAEVEF